MTEELTISLFLSYTHVTEDWEAKGLDEQHQRKRVLALAQRLRNTGGLVCEIDQYHENNPPPEGWPNWMRNQVLHSRFVLIVCTPTYYRRFHGEEVGKGQGAAWEGGLITQELYDACGRNEKFIPIGFDEYDVAKASIPDYLRKTNYYNVSKTYNYTSLLRHLTGQSRVVPASIGTIPLLPPEDDGTVNPS